MTPAQRTAIRIAADLGAHVRYPVEIIPGDAAPRLVGHGWHYVTSGGTVIDHPGAYSRRGWSNMHYVPSTRRVTVGEGWVP